MGENIDSIYLSLHLVFPGAICKKQECFRFFTRIQLASATKTKPNLRKAIISLTNFGKYGQKLD